MIFTEGIAQHDKPIEGAKEEQVPCKKIKGSGRQFYTNQFINKYMSWHDQHSSMWYRYPHNDSISFSTDALGHTAQIRF